MRVISLNINGLRAGIRKGLYDWLEEQRADFVCLQEIKARPEQLEEHGPAPLGYQCFYEPGERKGHSGVAIFSRVEPDKVIEGFGSKEFDPEGRYIELRFGKLSVVSLYAPSGSSNEARLEAKFRFMPEFSKHLAKLKRSRRHVVISGDWNVAHKEIDIKNASANRKRPGFLPEERAWLDQVFGPLGFIDVFRELNQEPDNYTWWSNRHPTTRERNVGWRIDYQAATPALASAARQVSVATEPRFSDHAPLVFDYDWDLEA